MAYTTIDNPVDYFTTVLSTSTGSALTIDTGFKPDWLWTKARNFARSHELHDTTRGDNKRLKSDATTAEESYSNYLTFTSTGATFGTNHNLGYHAEGATTGVSWAWKANGGTTATNTSGTNIDSTVQANTTAGFSIITYTGTGTDNDSIGHGLGAVPSMFIIKRRSGTEDWAVYHHKNTSAPETDHLLLNTTDATSDSDTRFSDQAPSSTVITLGNNAVVNANSSTYVCYAFAEKQGYSKFGSYTGNGSTSDGAFVYTGFSPAWVLMKRTSGTEAWMLVDNKRPGFNVIDDVLEPNDSAAEGASTDIDLLSNGFKLRKDNSNVSGETYIYMAFAESPFVSSKGVPTTAR